MGNQNIVLVHRGVSYPAVHNPELSLPRYERWWAPSASSTLWTRVAEAGLALEHGVVKHVLAKAEDEAVGCASRGTRLANVSMAFPAAFPLPPDANANANATASAATPCGYGYANGPAACAHFLPSDLASLSRALAAVARAALARPPSNVGGGGGGGGGSTAARGVCVESWVGDERAMFAVYVLGNVTGAEGIRHAAAVEAEVAKAVHTNTAFTIPHRLVRLAAQSHAPLVGVAVQAAAFETTTAAPAQTQPQTTAMSGGQGDAEAEAVSGLTIAIAAMAALTFCLVVGALVL